jgi:hypothetical protein
MEKLPIEHGEGLFVDAFRDHHQNIFRQGHMFETKARLNNI